MIVTTISYHLIILGWRHQPDLVVWNFAPFLSRLTYHTSGVRMTPQTFIEIINPWVSLPFILLCMSALMKLDIMYLIGVKQCIMTDEEEREQNKLIEAELIEREKFYANAAEHDQVHRADSSNHAHDSSMALADSAPSLYSRPNANTARKQLNTSGMYGYVRHPLYCWTQLLCFFTPYMTYDRFCYGIFTTLLLVVGIRFEELKLVREFGDQYRDYQQTTPMIFPIRLFKWNTQQKEVTAPVNQAKKNE